MNQSITTENELEFIFFCIEYLAIKTKKSGTEIYDCIAKKTDLLSNYIVPCYDVLHTQGKDYIVNDLLEHLKEKGIEL